MRKVQGLLFALALGPAFFLLETALDLPMLASAEGAATAPSVPEPFTYLLVFFPIGVAGVVLAAVPFWERWIPVILGLYGGGVLLAFLTAASLPHGLPIGIVLSLLLIAAALLTMPRLGFERPRATALVALVAAVLLYPVVEPARIVLRTPFDLAAHVVLLSGLVAVLFSVRKRWSRGSVAEFAILTLALVSPFGLHQLPNPCSAPRNAEPHIPASESASGDAAPPNVVLIVLDTVGRSHLSAYGYERETTPFLEQLAKSAVVYERATSVAPWTLPAHASMFTGLYPRTHGVAGETPNVTRVLPLTRETLAEKLRDAGYRTGAVSANYDFAGRRVQFDQGFDYFCEPPSQFYLHSSTRIRLHERALAYLSLTIPQRYRPLFSNPSADAAVVSRLALRWLDAANSKRPYFLFLNFMDVHWPYLPPASHASDFDGQASPPSLLSGPVLELRARAGGPVPAEYVTHLVAQYDANLRYLDEVLGEFVNSLRARGDFENTLFIVTSDHGEGFGEHEKFFHNASLYEEQIAIPLIVRYPFARSTGRDDAPIENRELFGLVLAEAGVKEPTSEDLTPDTIAEHYYAEKSVRRAIYFDHFKLIVDAEDDVELYDLENDPHERTNIAKQRPDLVKTGEDRLGAFMGSVGEGDSDHAPLDPSALQRLRVLGYVD